MTYGSRIALLLTSLCVLASSSAGTRLSPDVDQVAPNFQATTFDGTKLSLADFKGQVVVLNFWATWCGPCKQELPLLENYYRAHQGEGLRIFAIATEDSLKPYQLAPLAKVLTIPMVKRFKGNYGEITALPTNFVIDRSGIVRYAQAAVFNGETLAEVIGPLLAEPPP
jgi:cytochrome c biogenesis protein CcmG, thiol:disulfide interchange protein DsbE